MIVRAGVACTLFPSFKKGIVDTSLVAMIRRGKAPRLGQWSLPGGRVEWGEALAEGAKREVMEEISLSAASITVQLIQPSVYSFATTDAIHINENFHYIIAHVLAFVDCGDSVTPIPLRAGDDAVDATWVRVNDDDNKISESPPYPTLSSLNAGSQVMSVIKLAQLLVKSRIPDNQQLT